MRRVPVVCLLLAALAMVTACGSNDDSSNDSAASASAGGGGERSVKVCNAHNLTGLAAYVAKPAHDGFQFAMDQAAKDGLLKDVKVTFDVQDDATDPQQAVQIATKFASSGCTVMIYGNLSAAALAIAPIVQKAGLPTIFIQSGTAGLMETGDHIFRTTMPQELLAPLQSSYWKSKGVHTVATVYDKDSPTLNQLATKIYPDLAGKDGYKIVGSHPLSSTDKDLTSVVQKVVSEKPDAVFMGLQGTAQILTLVTQLNRAGYKGIIGGHSGTTLSTLKELGAKADGITYPIDFATPTPFESAKAFASDWRAAKGSAPDNNPAEGYDAAKLLIGALKLVKGDITRDSLQQALVQETQAGFAGATGPVKFDNRDARIPGVLIQIQGGKEKLLLAGQGS